MKKNLNNVYVWRVSIIAIGLTVLMGTYFSLQTAYAASPLVSQVGEGYSGTDVRNLQMFLAEYPALYPQGLVTGYFGTLTKQAVIRLQREYGIDPVGRVGPITLSRINSLMSGGATSPVYGPSPWISGVSQSILNNQATISWTTNENTLAKVFYNTSPVTMNEGDINSVGFGSTNGWTARSDMTARTNHQVTITGLQPNTTYYYVIVATDLDGNVSVWNPNTTFRTTQ